MSETENNELTAEKQSKEPEQSKAKAFDIWPKFF